MVFLAEIDLGDLIEIVTSAFGATSCAYNTPPMSAGRAVRKSHQVGFARRPHKLRLQYIE
ncbi:hypothetical protein ASD31_00120 [Rhizobium sp. Root482]|nr:hypothetical protein ASD31_00120 [Rhizobium sp. Root482]